MSVRVVVAGLLVGVVGILALVGAHFGELLLFKQVKQFTTDHPEAFPFPPNQARFWSAVATLWIGLFFGFLYDRMRPAGSLRAAAELGLVCWLGFIVPVLTLQFLWTHTSLYALGVYGVGYLLQLVLGGLALARILKPEREAVAGTLPL